MIKYKILCKNCNHSFDSWFSSSADYEKLKKLNHISCYKCNSSKIEKSLMSPNIVNSQIIEFKNKNSLKVKNKLKEYKKIIKNNFRYVGNDFVNEARSLHYDGRKNVKGIYGHASIQEIKELKEEGIESKVMP